MPTRRGVDDVNEQAAVDLDSAFAGIVDTYSTAVYTTSLRVSRQPADAEDLAAETFVRAYAALSAYPAQRIRSLQLRPWLLTITLNLWRNRLRDTSRRPSLVPLDPNMAVFDSDGSAEQSVVEAPGSGSLEMLVAGLPEAQRVAVLLRHVVGLSYAEISAVLDTPTGTVKSHVSRGLFTLRAQLRADEKEATS